MEEYEMGITHWMPLYTADVLSSCADMSPAQFGAYMRLLFYAWSSDGLPNDMEACCRIAGGCSPTDWAVVRKRLVVLDEGTSAERLSQPRLEAERAKAAGLHQKRVDNLSKARKARDDSPHPHPHPHPHPDSHSGAHPHPHPATQPQPQPQPQLQPHLQIQENTSPSEKLGATPQKRRRTYRVTWDSEKGFQGVTDEDISRWKAAYPGVDLTLETARAHTWVCDNPSKGGKRNWAAFLSRWFSRVQDKGGSAGPAPPQKTFREDAGKSMTASEYAAWKCARDREAYLKSKARKRTGGLQSLGEVFHERREAGPPASADG